MRDIRLFSLDHFSYSKIKDYCQYNYSKGHSRGTFSIRIAETPVGETVRKIKDGQYRVGEVIDLGEFWTEEATRRLSSSSQQSRPDMADAFLIRLREAFLH